MGEIVKQLKNPEDINTVLKKSGISQRQGLLPILWSSLPDNYSNQIDESKIISKTESLAPTALGMAASHATVILGGLMALSTLADEWKKYRGFDYNTNQEKASSSIEKYKNTSSELDATIAKLEEIKVKKEALASIGTFSFINKEEIQDLQQEYYTLKQQEQWLQTISSAEKSAASNAAARAMATTQESDVSSARFDHNINGEAYLDLNHKDVSYMNDAEQIKSLVTEITSVNSQMERLQELQSATTDTKQIKKYQDQIEDLNAYQLDLNNSLSERLKTASTNYSAIVGDEKYADLAKEYESAFLSIENMGKSTKEAKQNTLEHFFNSTDNQLLSNSLLDIARQGELTENVLKNLGITTGMIGKDVNVDDVIDYFNNLATAADNASASVKSLADMESIDSVTAAFISPPAISGPSETELNRMLKPVKPMKNSVLLFRSTMKFLRLLLQVLVKAVQQQAIFGPMHQKALSLLSQY